MKKPHHRTARLAARLEASFRRRTEDRVGVVDAPLAGLCLRLESIARLRNQLALCATRGLHLAAGRLLGKITNGLQNLATDLHVCEIALRQAGKPAPSLSSMCEELHEVEREFDDVGFRRDDESLTVVTEPIELEDVALGRFELCLLLRPLAKGNGYDPLRVVAPDPNPAASNEAVTHPHVRDGVLCAGDATAAMQAALDQGRVCDFFVIARSVLHTYNAGSAHVSLDDWHGRPCQDCGSTVDEDHCFWCDGCEQEYCDECVGWCEGCETAQCRGCLSSCTACKESRCEGCRESCRECSEPCCSGCLEDSLCPTCKQELEESDDNESQGQNEFKESRADRCCANPTEAEESCLNPTAGS